MSLHERLVITLQQHQMSHRDFANLLGYSESTVSKWTTGKLLPTIDTLMSICKAMNISADWLLFGNIPTKVSIESNGTPVWEAVTATFSTPSCSFDDFVESAQSIFFTSAWLTRAFDINNPTMERLVKRGILLRFIFPQIHINLFPHNANGYESPDELERSRYTLLRSLYKIKQWQQCSAELRLTSAIPVNNVLIANFDTDTGRVLYVPYLYGDFEHGIRPGFIIEQQRHPTWYEQFYTRYAVQMWSAAEPIDDIAALIAQVERKL